MVDDLTSMVKNNTGINSLELLKKVKEGKIPQVFLSYRNDDLLINLMGLDNLIRFESENHLFFTVQKNKTFWDLLKENSLSICTEEIKRKFKNSKTYEEFLDAFSNILELLRESSAFYTTFSESLISYHIIKKSFRDKYPHLFIADEASLAVKKAFYENNNLLLAVANNRKDIKYFRDKDILKLFELDNPFYQEYLTLFGEYALLNLITNYGPYLKNIDTSLYQNLKNQEDYDNFVMEQTYNCLKYDRVIFKVIADFDDNFKYGYTFLYDNSRFKEKYPELFLDFTKANIDTKTKEALFLLLAKDNLRLTDVARYPILKDLLVGKDLTIFFHNETYVSYSYSLSLGKKPIIETLLEYITDKEFLELCFVYKQYFGYALNYLADNVTLKGNYSYQDIRNMLDDYIYERILNGLNYDTSLDNISKRFQDIIIDKDAPLEVQDLFYNQRGISFTKLRNELLKPETKKYFDNKNLRPMLVRNYFDNANIVKIFVTLGYDETIKLGLRYPNIIDRMISEKRSNTLIKWYLALDKKYIPSYSVMIILENDISRFKKYQKWWHELFKVSRVKLDDNDAIAGLVKLAYSFGLFHGDDKGYQLLIDLFSIPKTIPLEYHDKMLGFINYYNPKYKDKLPNMVDIAQLKLLFLENNCPYDDNKNNILEVYKLCKDGSYRLIDKCLNWMDLKLLLSPMAFFNLPVVTQHMLHDLCGDFVVKYEPHFKDFFMENLYLILSDINVRSNIGLIEKQFKEIYAFNKNRKLTVARALDFIYSKEYHDIEVGNEYLALNAIRTGLSEEDFMTLQRMYALTKQRVVSSIPKISGEFAGFSYEVLRLDDALGFVIGNLTNCCQKLGADAEVSMEHSMTSSDGRIFVVYNKYHEIVAQSWLWRVGNTLCFDNIEIPWHVSKCSTGDVFVNIYKVYVAAAYKLMEVDRKTYEWALNNGLINEKTKSELALNKVTVGILNNDLNSILEQMTVRDNNPCHLKNYLPHYNLTHFLYTDSEKQVILVDNNGKISSNKALNLYFDAPDIKENLELIDLKMLKSLAKSRQENNLLEWNIASTLDLKNYYHFDNLRVIITPNIGIIFDSYENKIILGDIFINTIVNTAIKKV